MIYSLILLILLLTILYLLSRGFMQVVYTLAFLMTRSQTVAIWVLALLLLPGTILHELSHWLAATIFRVPTGNLSIFPSVEQDGTIRGGHVEIAKTGPFKLTVIGIAPMLTGFILLYFLGVFSYPYLSNIRNTNYLLPNILCLYFLFAVSATMFSSRRDVKPLIFVGPVILLVVASLYISGFRITATTTLIQSIEAILTTLNRTLAISVGLNAVLTLLIRGILTLTSKK
jgi:hypothetical protein